MIVALNYGYYNKALNTSGIIDNFPQIFKVKCFQQLELRAENFIDLLFQLSRHCHITPSSICLYITVNNHSFVIRMINVREFRAKWEQIYKSEWKFDRKLKRHNETLDQSRT